MAIPTIDNWTNANGAGPVTGTLPSGSGDFLVAFVHVDNVPPATPTGWTQWGGGIIGGSSTDVAHGVFTAPASVGTLQFAWPADATRDGSVTIYRISGSNSVVDAAFSNDGMGTATGTTKPIPTITTSVNDCLILGGIGSDSDSANAYTWPAGWTEDAEVATATTFLSQSTARSSLPTAGTVAAGDVTSSLSEHHGISIIAIQPTGATGYGNRQGPSNRSAMAAMTGGRF